MNLASARILSISTDRAITDASSPAYGRQEKLAQSFGALDIIMLGALPPSRRESGALRVIAPGGSSKASSFARSWRAARALMREHRYDAIYTQDVLYCGLLGYLLRRPGTKLITQLHGDYLDNPLWTHESIANRPLNALGKFIARRSDFIRCVSARIRAYVTETLRVPADRIVSIPIGIDERALNTDGAAPERTPNILFVGRLIPEKEPLFFCDAVMPVLEQHPEYRVTVIGDGFLKEDIRARFARAGFENRVELPGHLPPQEVAKRYRSAFILFHTAFWEGWGLPMVEASACGLPVLTTDTGCAGEVVIDGVNGVVLASKRAEDYAAAMEALIGDPSRYESLRANAARLAADWTSARMLEKTRSFFERALS